MSGANRKGGETIRELDEVIEAIKGSAGIKTNIARKLGVNRATVTEYLKRWDEAQAAFDHESSVMLDRAQSVVFANINFALQAANQEQEKMIDNKEYTPKPVDTSDAKWLLGMKGSAEGYRQGHDITSGGKEIAQITTVNFGLDKLKPKPEEDDE